MTARPPWEKANGETDEDEKVEPIRKSSGNPRLDAALDYAALGWFVFPAWWANENNQCACGGKPNCKSPAKHPISYLAPNGQDDATRDPDVIRQWWIAMPSANVAVHLSRSKMVAIDIDPRNGGLFTIEQLEQQHGEIQSDILAYSGGGGEHRVFRKPESIDSLPGKLGPGVDLKLNGYILVEPSNHISGGVYEWEGSSDPADGAIASPLPDWIRSLGQVKQKHTIEELVDSISRYATEKQTDEIRSALMFIQSDDRDTWVNYGNALKPLGQVGFNLWDEWSQRSDKYDSVDAIRVWKSCKPGIFNFESIFHEAQEKGWVNPLVTGGLPEAPEIEEPKSWQSPPMVEAGDEIPQAVLQPPFKNLLKTVDWLDGYSIKTNRIISLVGALAIAQGATARIYQSAQYGNPSTIYSGIIARTGAAKDYIRQAYSSLFYAVGAAEVVGKGGFSSGAGIRDNLRRKPGCISYLDEFGDMIKHGITDKGGPAKDRLATFRKAFNTGPLEDVGYAMRGPVEDEEPVMDPCLGLVGLTTKEQFLCTLTDEMLADGTINRFVIVNADIKPIRNVLPNKDVPAWLIDHVSQLRSAPAGGGNLAEISTGNSTVSPVWVKLPFESDAVEYIQTLGDVEDDTTIVGKFAARGTVETLLSARWRELAMRLSTALAAYEGKKTIPLEMVQWAYEFISHYGEYFVGLYKREAQQSDVSKTKQKLLEFIRRGGQKGRTQTQISRGRPGRDMLRNFKKQLLDDLVESGEIIQETIPGKKKPITVFYAVELG